MALSIAFIVFHVMAASSTTETKSWQTLYRNDIKADITLENGHYIAMTPNDITSRADVDKLLTRIKTTQSRQLQLPSGPKMIPEQRHVSQHYLPKMLLKNGQKVNTLIEIKVR